MIITIASRSETRKPAPWGSLSSSASAGDRGHLSHLEPRAHRLAGLVGQIEIRRALGELGGVGRRRRLEMKDDAAPVSRQTSRLASNRRPATG